MADPDTVRPAAAGADADGVPPASLVDDVSALIEDGQTYLSAELAYQKTRLGFATAQGKSSAVLLLAVFAFLHLALIALVVGLVITLSPMLTPLGATMAVVLALLLLALLAGLAARKRIGAIARAFAKDKP